jgi:hypothetical protein
VLSLTTAAAAAHLKACRHLSVVVSFSSASLTSKYLTAAAAAQQQQQQCSM